MNQLDKQETPRDTLAKWHHAIKTNDEKAFLEVYADSPEFDAAILSAFRGLQACMEFRKRLTELRGPDAWGELENTKTRISFFPVLPPASGAWWNEAKVEIDGNKATIEAAWDEGGSLSSMTKIGPNWKVGHAFAHIDPKAAQKFWNTLTPAIQQCTKNAENKSITYSDLMNIIGEAYLKAVKQEGA